MRSTAQKLGSQKSRKSKVKVKKSKVKRNEKVKGPESLRLESSKFE